MSRLRTVVAEMPAPTAEGKDLPPEQRRNVLHILEWLLAHHPPFQTSKGKGVLSRLAKAIDVQQSTLYNIMEAQINSPSMKVVRGLAAFLGASENDILHGTLEEPFVPKASRASPLLRAVHRLRDLLGPGVEEDLRQLKPPPDVEWSELDWIGYLVVYAKLRPPAPSAVSEKHGKARNDKR